MGIDEAHISNNAYGLFFDIEKHKPIELLRNNTYNEMSRFLNNVDYSNVKVVVIDMTPKYKRLIKTIIPDAHIVIDKFHIQQDVQKAFKKELAKYDNIILYEIRTLLLYKRESLSYEQQQLLNEYISRYPQVSFIYEIKELPNPIRLVAVIHFQYYEQGCYIPISNWKISHCDVQLRKSVL